MYVCKWGYYSLEKPIKPNPISAKTKFKIIDPGGSGLRERESNPGEPALKTERTPVNGNQLEVKVVKQFD